MVLHSYYYMTNLLASAEPVRQTGKLFAPLGGARIAMIDPRDTGAVAAAALVTNPVHTVIESGHPSPLNGGKDFFGARMFSVANKALADAGRPPINWDPRA